MGRLESQACGLDLSWVVARTEAKRILSRYGYTGFDSLGRELLWALAARDHSPFRRTEPARFLRLSTPVKPTPWGRAEAEKRLDDLLNLLRPQLAGVPTCTP